jgi:GntR family transcriptional regulator/MocR family aminotransferase
VLIRLRGPEPLHLQIYRALRAAILGGTLPPGSRLPSTRTLAADTGAARNTVLLAYDQLLGEGYAVTRRGSGTYVTAELPDRSLEVAGPPAAPLPRGRPRPPRLSHYGARIRDWTVSWEARDAPVPYDFRYGRPDFAHFPSATWRRLLARRARAVTERDLDYGPAAGAPELREAVAAYLARARGVVCEPDQIVIVRGSQQGIDLVGRILLDPGTRVAFEEPHYPGARAALVAAGARIAPVPVDGDGMDVAALDARARGARLVYVTPSHQFPTGAVMSLARRLALLAWAEREDAYVLEDDYDSEYRYTGRPIESLQGLDRSARVIYTGTFSKVLFPGLRLGYLVLPRTLVRPLTAAKALADAGTASLEQLALADFIRQGHFERHIRRSRARHLERRAALAAALAEHLGDLGAVSGGSAGIHVLLWLRGVPADRTAACIARACEAGVGIYSAAFCFLRPPREAGVILGYSGLAPAAIRTGIRKLAGVLRSASWRTRGPMR